jgi:hypothetical protein
MASQQPRSQNSSRMSTLPSQKPRQLSHLHSQLAQLTAHVSDLENLLRMTAVQAESMRSLGGYAGAMYTIPFIQVMTKQRLIICDFRFMAASKVLGEETINNNATSAEASTDSQNKSTNA